MNVLAIGAHPDDIALGCSGTLLRLKEEGNKIHCLTLTAGQTRPGNRFKEEMNFMEKAGFDNYILWEYEDGKLQVNADLVTKMDKIWRDIRPKFVFTHYAGDHHHDHQVVAEITKSANRNYDASVYSYSNMGHGFEPNFYVEIGKHFKKKLDLLSVYTSQHDRWYFNADHVISRHKSLLPSMNIVEKFRVEFAKL